MDVRGNGGVLRVGPYEASQLGAWTLSRAGADSTLDGALVNPDAYWSRQPVTVVKVAMGHRWWVWRDVRVTLREDGTVTANLRGVPETETRT